MTMTMTQGQGKVLSAIYDSAHVESNVQPRSKLTVEFSLFGRWSRSMKRESFQRKTRSKARATMSEFAALGLATRASASCFGTVARAARCCEQRGARVACGGAAQARASFRTASSDRAAVRLVLREVPETAFAPRGRDNLRFSMPSRAVTSQVSVAVRDAFPAHFATNGHVRRICSATPGVPGPCSKFK